jgi:hypothetical protein
LQRTQCIEFIDGRGIQREVIVDGIDQKGCVSRSEAGSVSDGEGEVDAAVEVGVRSEGPAVDGVSGDGTGVGDEVGSK